MYCLGIDPGNSGALAVLTLDGRAALIGKMPLLARHGGKCVDAVSLLAALKPYAAGTALCAFELVGPRPEDGKKSLAVFMRATGAQWAVVQLLGLPCEEVAPQSWKAVILKGTKRDKEAAIAYATSRWPTTDLRATPRCTTPDDNLAEALCLAEYARRRVTGETK